MSFLVTLFFQALPLTESLSVKAGPYASGLVPGAMSPEMLLQFQKYWAASGQGRVDTSAAGDEDEDDYRLSSSQRDCPSRSRVSLVPPGTPKLNEYGFQVNDYRLREPESKRKVSLLRTNSSLNKSLGYNKKTKCETRLKRCTSYPGFWCDSVLSALLGRRSPGGYDFSSDDEPPASLSATSSESTLSLPSSTNNYIQSQKTMSKQSSSSSTPMRSSIRGVRGREPALGQRKSSKSVSFSEKLVEPPPEDLESFQVAK